MCKFFNWTAGNVNRIVKWDDLNGLIYTQFHIACYQEASPFATQALLQDARGFASVANHCATIMINVGGSGVKPAKKIHSEEDHHCGNVHRPAYCHQPPPDLGLGEERAGAVLHQRGHRASGLFWVLAAATCEIFPVRPSFLLCVSGCCQCSYVIGHLRGAVSYKRIEGASYWSKQKQTSKQQYPFCASLRSRLRRHTQVLYTGFDCLVV